MSLAAAYYSSWSADEPSEGVQIARLGFFLNTSEEVISIFLIFMNTRRFGLLCSCIDILPYGVRLFLASRQKNIFVRLRKFRSLLREGFKKKNH